MEWLNSWEMDNVAMYKNALVWVNNVHLNYVNTCSRQNEMKINSSVNYESTKTSTEEYKMMPMEKIVNAGKVLD